MKKIIKEFIPPILLKTLRSIVPAKPVDSRPRFSSYEEALKLCTTDAYEKEELIEVIYKKTKTFSENLNLGIPNIGETNAYSFTALINPIIESKTNEIKVLDFGGACGAHYFYFKSLVDKKIKLKWAVVETATMVRHAKGLETEELSFFDNFSDAKAKLGTIDLLHTSGTLQCVDNPEVFLNEIINCDATWILFNRLALNKLDRKVIILHSTLLSGHGIGKLPDGYKDRLITVPLTYTSEATFLNTLQKKYSLFAKFNDQSGMIPVQGEEIVGYGLLCKRNPTAIK